VSDPPPDERPDPHRLDPDRAAAEAAARSASPPPAAAPEPSPGDDAPPGSPTGGPTRPALPSEVDTRRYGWMIGIFGLILVAGISVYQFARHGVGSPGVPPGKQLHLFVAPLATVGPDLDANLSPRCDPAHPNPLALNVCGRTPLVLTFFTPGSNACVRQVNTLQRLSAEFAGTPIRFAAVAINTAKAQARQIVRAHRWTIPVAFDRDGALASLYGIEICPIIELARPGGVVEKRLIGEHWIDPHALASQVSGLQTR
jgi:thiol-disulfide isomerase/thioredoxin